MKKEILLNNSFCCIKNIKLIFLSALLLSKVNSFGQGDFYNNFFDTTKSVNDYFPNVNSDISDTSMYFIWGDVNLISKAMIKQCKHTKDAAFRYGFTCEFLLFNDSIIISTNNYILKNFCYKTKDINYINFIFYTDEYYRRKFMIYLLSLSNLNVDKIDSCYNYFIEETIKDLNKIKDFSIVKSRLDSLEYRKRITIKIDR